MCVLMSTLLGGRFGQVWKLVVVLGPAFGAGMIAITRTRYARFLCGVCVNAGNEVSMFVLRLVCGVGVRVCVCVCVSVS